MFTATEIGEELAHHGLRLTEQRAAVVQAAADFRGSFSADELWLASRRTAAGLGIATVYRTLDVLLKIGAIERVHGREGCESFVATGEGHKHLVVCRGCGATSELTDLDCEDFLMDVARHTGFHIDEHVIQLQGLCARCEEDRS